jgi:hypothetical protein
LWTAAFLRAANRALNVVVPHASHMARVRLLAVARVVVIVGVVFGAIV